MPFLAWAVLIMVVAITGGTGFIGKRLVRELALANHHVRILTRTRTGVHPELPNVSYFRGDLSDDGSLATFLDGAEVLFHCAGEVSDISRMEHLHVAGTKRLIEAASGRVRHWVQLSSTGAFGPRRSGEITERDPLHPVGPYETTKVASDELVVAASTQGAFTHAILRPSIVFGGDMPNRSLFSMLRMIERSLFFFIGRPGASANYVHVDNVVHALVLCGFSHKSSGGSFNLSDHLTVEDFVGHMASVLEVSRPTLRLPEGLVRLSARLLGGLPGFPLTQSRIDALTSFVRFPINHIENELGYQHRISMAEGIAELVRGYRERFN